MALSRIKIVDGLPDAGRLGVLYFTVRPARDGVSGEDWAVVLWDDEPKLQPDFYERKYLVPA